MARGKSDYFGLGYIVSVILAIIPVTSWLLGAITRLTEGKIVSFILRLVLGWNIIWICDLVLMIISKHILRLLNIKNEKTPPRGDLPFYVPPFTFFCATGRTVIAEVGKLFGSFKFCMKKATAVAVALSAN